MQNIEYAELEANFQQYVERAHSGEDFIITRDGQPLARLIAHLPTPSRIGFCKERASGTAFSFEDFQAADKEVEDLFFSSEIYPQDSSTAGPEATKSPDADKGGQ